MKLDYNTIVIRFEENQRAIIQWHCGTTFFRNVSFLGLCDFVQLCNNIYRDNQPKMSIIKFDHYRDQCFQIFYRDVAAIAKNNREIYDTVAALK